MAIESHDWQDRNVLVAALDNLYSLPVHDVDFRNPIRIQADLSDALDLKDRSYAQDRASLMDSWD
jgi:hypothetical protein